jgi:hypothetical protein
MQDFVSIAGALFGIIGTIAAIYFSQKSQEANQKIVRLTEQNTSLVNLTTVATIDLRINNPPPYESDRELSEIVAKNVGQRTSRQLAVSASCSWSEETEHHFKFPTANWVLQPGEEYRWKVRFGYPPNIVGHKIVLNASEVTTPAQQSTTWEHTEKIA